MDGHETDPAPTSAQVEVAGETFRLPSPG
ncbi:transcriptional regulator, partial [Burkholderia multivorans]